MLAEFPFELFIEHMAYNREAQRAYLSAASRQHQKRIYKAVVIADMVGLSFAHTSGRFVGLMRTFNSIFSYNYPETFVKVYSPSAGDGCYVGDDDALSAALARSDPSRKRL